MLSTQFPARDTILVALILLLQSIPAVAVPTVTNPSFEVDLSGWSLWTGTGSNTDPLEREWQVPAGGAPDGAWAMAVKGIGSGGKGAYQYIASGWDNGNQYRLSVMARNLANTNINYAIGYSFGNSGAGGASTALFGSLVVHPASWTAATVDFTYFGTEGVTLYLKAINDGNVERAGFDYVTITDLGPSGPTSTPTQTPPPGNTNTPTITPTRTPTSVNPTTPTRTPTVTNTPIPGQTPVITNPSFETDLNGWTPWKGVVSNNDPLERDFSGYDGGRCMGIKGMAAGDVGKGAYQYVQNGWIYGHVYRLSAWCKNLTNSGMNYSIGYVFGNLGVNAVTSANYSSTIIHPSNWTNVSVEFIYTGSSGVTVYLRVVHDGHSERAGFDYITITDLGVSPATPTPQSGLSISNVQTSGTSVGKYELWTVDFDLSRTYFNPYDERIIDASLSFTGPSGIERVIPAYWTNETRKWRAKIAPMETGAYTIQLRANDIENRYTTHNVNGFTSVPSSNKGFIRRDPRNVFHMIFDNGTPFHPMGHNLCWSIADTIHATYRQRLADAGGNWTRLWMSMFGSNPEWGGDEEPENAGLGRYSQIISQRYDNVLADMRSRGLYTQMCLDTFNPWSCDVNSAWEVNPYNMNNGGMCGGPMSFFTHPEAIRLNKQRYRYIISRWAAETSVFCWELFNEVDACGSGCSSGTYFGMRDIGADWHQEMGAYIQSIDPFDHLVTTSFANPFDNDLFPEVWNKPAMDLVQIHRYSSDVPKNQDQMIRTARQFNKPILVGEAGADSSGPYSVGASLHKMIWSGAVAESGMMSWWWQTVESNDEYYHYNGLAAFMNGEDMAPKNLSPATVSILSSHTTNQVWFAGSAGSDYAYIWVWNLTGSPMTGLRINLPQVTANNVYAEYWNTGGTIAGTESVTRSGGILQFHCPAIGGDLAIKVRTTTSSPKPATLSAW